MNDDQSRVFNHPIVIGFGALVVGLLLLAPPAVLVVGALTGNGSAVAGGSFLVAVELVFAFGVYCLRDM